MEDQLPRKPERPLDSDCCGQGCDPCVLDLYEEEVKIWEEECRRIIAGETQTGAGHVEQDEVPICLPLISPVEYRIFVVDLVKAETADSFRFRFKLPQGTALGLRAGQHIVIRGEVDGRVITREYTPVSDVHLKSSFELLIKIYEDGCMSQYIRTWKTGTRVGIRGPCGHFEYRSNRYRHVYMLAVGTGIAPMAQVIQAILNNEDDETMITLLHGSRTYKNILLKTELDYWSGFWNFNYTYCLSQVPVVDLWDEDKLQFLTTLSEMLKTSDISRTVSGPGFLKKSLKEVSSSTSKYRYGDKILYGRISSALVQSVINTSQENFFVLICGTRSFDQDMIQCMADLDIPHDKYHKF